MEQLIQDVEQYLDIDPRFFNKDDGSFLWDEYEVFFRKVPDAIFLFVDGVFYEAIRQ